jgi:hypothetical protein
MFTISASCAEGSPGSITNAMKLGIIPILAREAGINGDDGVIIMNDLSIEGIKYMIRKCSTETPERLSKLSLEATQRAERDFTESAFKKRWIEMIEDVVRTAIMNDQKQ